MQLIIKVSILIFILTILGGCGSGKTAFNKGQKLEETGDLDQAVIKYAEAATANPGIGEYRLRFLKACADAARVHLEKGDNLAATKNYEEALRQYQTAFTLDPSLENARQHAEKINKILKSQVFFKEGEELEKTHKNRDALRAYRQAIELYPANTEAISGIERISKSARPKLEGFELNLKSTKPITLKFKDAKIKEVFTILTKLSGINFIFDDAVKDANFSIYLENGTFFQALDVITELNKLDRKILNESNVIIYPRNPEKKKQYEELYLQTFYLTKIDAKKAINLLRTMMQIKKIYVNEEMNAIVIRDSPEVIKLAGKILEANDIPDPEVILEVEVIELSKKNADNLGLLLSRYAISAQGFNNGTPFTDTLNTTTTTPTGTTQQPLNPSNLLQLIQYKKFGGFLTVPNVTFNFSKTLSNAETLANPKMRIKNKEKAKFNVGTRVPITTTSSPTGGGVSVNVQYVDVGVKMNAEPTIQLNNEISMKLSLEVSSILSRDTVGGTGSATTVVTIGTRNLDTVLSLKDGETSIIGGLIQDQKSKSKQKVSFLGDIPILGSIFAGNDEINEKQELILAITPRIVRSLAVPDPTVAAFWSGKEDDPSTVKNYQSFNQEIEAAPAAPGTVAVPSAPGSPEPKKPVGDATLQNAVTVPAVPAPTSPLPATQPKPPVPGAVAPQNAVSVSAVPAPTLPLPATQSKPPIPGAVAPQKAVPTPAVPAPTLPLPAIRPNSPVPGAAVPQPAVPVPPVPAPAPAPAPALATPVVAPQSMKFEAESPAAKKAVLKVTAPKTVKTNDEFQVAIDVSDATNVYNGMLVVQYDPGVLNFVDSVEGKFLNKDGKPTSYKHVFNALKGRVNLNMYRIGNVNGVSGSGTLAYLTFKAKAKGTAKLGLSDVYLLPQGSNKYLNVDLHSPTTEVQ